MLDYFSFWGGGAYIDEASNSKPIEIVSNSRNDILEIKSEQERITNVEVISIIGEKLLHKSNYNISNIDISSLNTGIYLILCKTDNSNYWYSKFIKL